MCLFCKMVSKEIQANVVFEDDEVLAFHDIHPQAPMHVLVIPKKHVASLAESEPGDEALLGKLMMAARRAAEQTGIARTGFRVVVNSGAQAGQSVFHLHLHVLGGRPMAWPPG
jgi:histidine triad (HIT) family protein